MLSFQQKSSLLLCMGCIYQIWTNFKFHANMKYIDDSIIFRSRDFKKAGSPCRQELRSPPNFDKSRFRGTDSIKDNHRQKHC